MKPLLSPDTSVILRPRISKNSYAELFIGLRVSTAIGRNRYAVDSIIIIIMFVYLRLSNATDNIRYKK